MLYLRNRVPEAGTAAWAPHFPYRLTVIPGLSLAVVVSRACSGRKWRQTQAAWGSRLLSSQRQQARMAWDRVCWYIYLV